MGTIRIDAASSAMFLSLSISAGLLSVQAFSNVFSDILFGVALVLLSVTTMISGITSASSKISVLNLLPLLLATVWMSDGITSTWTGINERCNITSSANSNDYLLPGYGASVLVVLLLLIVSLYNIVHRQIAVLCAICGVLFTFKIISIWLPSQNLGVIYIILVLFMGYFWLSNALEATCGGNTVAVKDSTGRHDYQSKSQDYHVMWFATNTISYAVFAVQVTTLSEKTQFAFAWPISSGIIQLILGVSALRRYDVGGGMHIILYGLVWTAVGSNLWLEIYQEYDLPLASPMCAILMLYFIILTIINIRLEVLRAVSCCAMALFILSLCVDGNRGIFVGITACLGFVVSLYGVFAHLSQMLSFRFKVPIGILIFDEKSKTGCISKINICSSKVEPTQAKGSLSSNVMLGYAKFVDVQCLGYLVNSVAALSIITNSSPYSLSGLPYCLGLGGIVQFIVGFIAFSRGHTFESCSYLIYASFWSIWGTVRILDLNDDFKGTENVSGCIAFFIISITLVGLSITVSIVWFCISCCFSLLVLSFIIDGLSNETTEIFQIIISSIFALILLYAFLSSYFKNMFGRDILPTGKPMLTISLLTHGVDKTILADSRRATGVRQIADMMNSGKICGIPSDTVYILTAACNQPEAVERAYKTKKLAEDRPMSVWLSNLSQIQTAEEEFGPILWDFLKEIWPSNISAVVKRGEWVKALGIEDSARYIGKPDSIAIRIPDSSIVCHLIDQTGPIAVTSANPTGEADTTHHWQVIAKLGDKNCDGVLCDGPSPENAASTVVDCRNVSNGKIGFFRIGLTPKSTVEEIFEKVLKKHNINVDNKSDSAISTISIKEDLGLNGCHNEALEVESDIEIPVAEKTTLAFPSSSFLGSVLARSSSNRGGKSKHSNTHKENPVYTGSVSN